MTDHVRKLKTNDAALFMYSLSTLVNLWNELSLVSVSHREIRTGDMKRQSLSEWREEAL